ncbi:MAG: helix-turn-helix domain-containing protein [Proteobacteria bacterium]|nr:helix-turn-helix domain-containing protein [Pseudomonadota bacterium]
MMQSRPRILVVEESYPTALAVCDMIVRHGCDVAGMVEHVDKGLEFVRDNALDGAVIDGDLQGDGSSPLCEQLRKRDIPFMLLKKPVDDREFGRALAGFARPSMEGERANHVLGRLAPADWQALQPHLERVTLTAGEKLSTADGEIDWVYFPITGLVSVSARNARGKAVEVALVGREGIAGGMLMLGPSRSPGLESVMQVAGSAWRAPAGALMPLLERRPELRTVLLAAVHAFVGQMSDSAVSIGSSTIEQRLARRLLLASLRLGTPQLVLTHEALAKLLAVRRSGVTVALHMLEARKVLRSRRNLVEILDYEGLVQAAGEDGLGCTEPGALPSR